MLDNILKTLGPILNRNTGPGLQVNNYASGDESFKILDDLINYANQKVSTKKDIEINDSNLTDFKLKIEINFDDEETKEAFKERYGRLLKSQYLNIIEEYLYNTEDEKRDGTILRVQQLFKSILESDTSDKKVIKFSHFEDISMLLIPEAKKGDPKYILFSNGLVLHVFEKCDIGLRTKKEVEALTLPF